MFRNRFKEPIKFIPLLSGLGIKAIAPSDFVFMDSVFTREEVRAAVWESDGDKSPGPDRYNFRFLQECWEFLEDDIFRFASEFHKTTKLPKSITASFIALIPKNLNPQCLNEYRSICLAGFLYKILSKILANRLKKVLPSVISHSQSGFVSGRQILDGVLALNEVIDLAKKEKKECFIFKADYQQAYDCVNWDILRSLFQKLGFGSNWCRWMEACIFNSSMSILVNGSPTQDFWAERGLSQGDPLSPFLFTLVVEILAGLVKKVETLCMFEGFIINTEVDVKILQFADDTIILGSGCWNYLRSIKSIFRGFELISGLKVNFFKSKIFGVNIKEESMEGASQFLCCCRDELPFKFLDISVGSNPRRCETWNPILQSLKKKLSNWKAGFLSIGGRVTLLNSVLSSIPIYTLSFYLIKEIIQI